MELTLVEVEETAPGLVVGVAFVDCKKIIYWFKKFLVEVDPYLEMYSIMYTSSSEVDEEEEKEDDQALSYWFSSPSNLSESSCNPKSHNFWAKHLLHRQAIFPLEVESYLTVNLYSYYYYIFQIFQSTPTFIGNLVELFWKWCTIFMWDYIRMVEYPYK